MGLRHGIVWMDHQSALVLQFDSEQVLSQHIERHTHPTPQHGSGVRAEHEYYGKVCNALEEIGEIIVAGSHTALADFRHYADKHRPLIAARIIAYEVAERLSQKQLLALARPHFLRHDQREGSGVLH